MVSMSSDRPEQPEGARPAGWGRTATDAEKAQLATVVEVLDPKNVVLNRGQRDGVTFGSRFVVFEQTGRELTDPDTGESLGALEVPRGTGSVTHLQERVCVVTCDERAASAPFPTMEAVDTRLPFRAAAVGDRARLLWRNG